MYRNRYSIQKQEDKALKQQCYGYYCNKCKKLNISPVSYTNFSLELWDILRKQK